MKKITDESLIKILAWATRLPERQILQSLSNGESNWCASAARAISDYCAGVPLGYVLGEICYFGRTFRSDSRALAIRTYNEVIVRRVIEDWSQAQPRCLEVGCGAGATIITLALELKGAFIGTDLDLFALELAQENARRWSAPVQFLCADLFSGIAGGFDVIMGNVPWHDPNEPVSEAAWEPDKALYDRTGTKLGLIRAFLSTAPNLLRPSGLVYLEVPETPAVQSCFVGWPLVLSHGEVIGFRMNVVELAESLKRLEEFFGTRRFYPGA